MPTTGKSTLETSLSKILERRRTSQTLRTLSTPPPNSIDFSSNDFLSLASNATLYKIFLNLLQNPSNNLLGSGGSRLLDGNSIYAEKLETSIATFHNASAGLLCNSGFDANVGLFSCLPQPNDYIVYDEAIHASVHDGMRLSRASKHKCLPFAHNNVNSLRRALERIIATDQGVKDGTNGNVFVAVETVYSMDGDVAPLRDIVATVKAVLAAGNGHCIVDEAHSTGVYGPRGKGLVCELGLEQEFLVRLHTFGKALACNGAVLLCSPTIREYLVNYARSLIYTTFMSYPALTAIEASYRFLMDGQTEPLATNLKCLISKLHLQLLQLQASLELPESMQHILQVPTDCPESPIFALLSSEPKALASFCQQKGLIVRGIVPPTVPAGTERVRICLHAGNTAQQIEELVKTIKLWTLQRIEASNHGIEIRARM